MTVQQKMLLMYYCYRLQEICWATRFSTILFPRKVGIPRKSKLYPPRIPPIIWFFWTCTPTTAFPSWPLTRRARAPDRIPLMWKPCKASPVPLPTYSLAKLPWIRWRLAGSRRPSQMAKSLATSWLTRRLNKTKVSVIVPRINLLHSFAYFAPLLKLQLWTNPELLKLQAFSLL